MNINELEEWYLKHHRKLVFRESREPYKIWVSEIMLQQTQVDTVLPFFERFIKMYPTVFELANTYEDSLHKAVEGLGYYRRFRYMLKAAKVIVETYDGVFPSTYKEVLALPGIGKYTAGAIMSIAYNMPYSALDGNVIRVLSRYLNVSDDMRIEKHRKALDAINQKYIEESTPYIYTQAMMELGALVCRPKNPKCEKCPLNEYCQAFEQGIQDQLPMLSKLKEKKELNYITLIMRNHDDIYVYKREEELLKGMYLYPQFESESIYQVISDLEEKGTSIEVIDQLKTYKHVFTHLVWHMSVYEVRIISGGNHLPYERIKFSDIDRIPMAIAHRKIKI